MEKNYFVSDNPIRDFSEDRLERTSFSKQLAKAICRYNQKDGLVIGLYGKWGNGKTSVINLVLQEISSISTQYKNPPIVVSFNPWNYSDRDNLILRFFQCLKSQIDIKGTTELKNEIGDLLVKYSKLFGVLSLVPGGGNGLSNVLQTTSNLIGEFMVQTDSIDDTRDSIKKILKKRKQKIIVIIDDIDRLSNNQIRDIFHMVKQVADFPNIVYLMAMDYDIVVKALEEIHQCNGREYLEKIVQVSFEIPRINNKDLERIFKGKFITAIHTSGCSMTGFDLYYWRQIKESFFDQYVDNVRDINRVINTFCFKNSLLKGEICIEDLFALTVLELMEPRLYQWISENKEVLCENNNNSSYLVAKQSDAKRNYFTLEFEKLEIDVTKAIKAISTLFPSFGQTINNSSYYHVYENYDYREHMCVCCSERFDLYFALDLTKVPISRMTINSCLNEYGEEDLIKKIRSFINHNKADYFISEIMSLKHSINEERIVLFLRILYQQKHSFDENDNGDLMSISGSAQADICIESLLREIKKETVIFDFLREAIQTGDLQIFGGVSLTIYRIKCDYEKNVSNNEFSRQLLITAEHLLVIENLYKTRIMELAKTEDLTDSMDYSFMMALWEKIDSDKAMDYIEQELKNPKCYLKHLCRYAKRWIGTSESGWDFDFYTGKKYISREETISLIDNYNKETLFDDFSEKELIQLASFCSPKNKKRTTEKQAKQLVEKWKNG